MTNNQIDLIIQARNEITRLYDWQHLTTAVDALDAILASVPPGQRNDVDLLLGRGCAVLAKRIVMIQHAGGEIETDPEWVQMQREMEAQAAHNAAMTAYYHEYGANAEPPHLLTDAQFAALNAEDEAALQAIEDEQRLMRHGR